MRLSKEDTDAKIVLLYKSGCSFRQLQKRYRKSPNYIAKLVKGIEVTCTACGKPKSGVRFHAHHPDRLNRPDYTLPFCPSCHTKEEAKLKQERKEKTQSTLSTSLSTKGNIAGSPSRVSFSFRPEPFTSTEKKVLKGAAIAAIVGYIVLVPQEAYSKESKTIGKKKIMGLRYLPHQE